MNDDVLPLVTAGFLVLAGVAFRFWVAASEASLRIIELTDENKRIKARYRKTSCSPSSTSHDAIIAAFIFGLVLASPPSREDKCDSGRQRRIFRSGYDTVASGRRCSGFIGRD